MFQAARHTLRRAATRAAFANATAFPRAALAAGEGAAASRSASPSAVAAVQASRAARGFRASSLAFEEASPPEGGERGLSQVLGEELEHERTTYVPSEVVAKGPPEPFEMIETDGDCEITLVRAFGDDEEIAVTFNATEDPYEEDEYFVSDADGAATNEAEDEDEDVTIHFSVSVSRGDGHEGLEFSCATDGETVEVRNVRYEAIGGGGGGEADEDDEDEYFSSYPGPNYDELDESVQEEFHKYLEARGIDATLANYIAEAHVDKEQREYTRWLENVANFVK
jgi:complement component 1 Q subcomponent-binding protein